MCVNGFQKRIFFNLTGSYKSTNQWVTEWESCKKIGDPLYSRFIVNVCLISIIEQYYKKV